MALFNSRYCTWGGEVLSLFMKQYGTRELGGAKQARLVPAAGSAPSEYSAAVLNEATRAVQRRRQG